MSATDRKAPRAQHRSTWRSISAWRKGFGLATLAALLISAQLAGTLFFNVQTVAAADLPNGINAPTEGRVVRGVVDVIGTAIHPTFRKWQLDLLLNGDEQQATFVAVGEEQAERAILTTLDTTAFPNGDHVLRLRVVHSNLNYDEYHVPVTFSSPQQPAAVQEVSQSLKPAVLEMAPPQYSGRWIEVDLSEQKLWAREGDTVFMSTLISSGLSQTPTVVGEFAVEKKLESQRMRGPGYDLPDVPAVMYFYWNYAIHGAYWHDNFGQPMSHGCVNMTPEEAAALYAWADIGTPVYVHE